MANIPNQRTDAERLLSSAEGFAALADSAIVGSGNQPLRGSVPVALYFNLAQAMELAIKAWLAMDGVPLGDLKDKYGHNLERLTAGAKARGLALVSGLPPRDLKMLNDAYAGAKELQYPITDGFVLPQRRPVREMVDACIAVASQSIRGQVKVDRPGASIRPNASW